MAPNLLASLAVARIIERTGRGRSVLRITPRFLAHAEGTAQGHEDQAEVLCRALQTWDGYHHDPRAGAAFLRDALADQLGNLCPAFPSIESFRAAA